MQVSADCLSQCSELKELYLHGSQKEAISHSHLATDRVREACKKISFKIDSEELKEKMDLQGLPTITENDEVDLGDLMASGRIPHDHEIWSRFDWKLAYSCVPDAFNYEALIEQ